ncbi:MAG: hypothetical protein GF353_12875 [Candidatus Lokiarchaeota archaeon]|nr:hypothetical protein [Candidatus Lokiarchaeota archaeon]
MAKKKKTPKKEEDFEIPSGKVDEDGDEIIDLFEEDDDLTDDVDYDLTKIDDNMLADEDEDEEFGTDVSEVEKMLRRIKCEPCPGSSSKLECKVRDDFGCPPDKANK